MISVYDVMKERLQTAEGTMMVTILSGPLEKGIKLFMVMMVQFCMVHLLKGSM